MPRVLRRCVPAGRHQEHEASCYTQQGQSFPALASTLESPGMAEILDNFRGERFGRLDERSMRQELVHFRDHSPAQVFLAFEAERRYSFRNRDRGIVLQARYRLV